MFYYIIIYERDGGEIVDANAPKTCFSYMLYENLLKAGCRMQLATKTNRRNRQQVTVNIKMGSRFDEKAIK